MTTVYAELYYLESGRRRQVHRELYLSGVSQIGTERCNRDDRDRKFPDQRIIVTPVADRGDGLPVGFDDTRLCGHCFPDGPLKFDTRKP